MFVIKGGSGFDMMESHSLRGGVAGFIVCRLFDGSRYDWCEKVAHCGFYLHFSDNECDHPSLLPFKYKEHLARGQKS